MDQKFYFVRFFGVTFLFIALHLSSLVAENSRTARAEKPGSLLMSDGRLARDEGRFSEAISLMKEAIDSPWGRSEFKMGLKIALSTVESEINQASRSRLEGYLSPSQKKGSNFLALFIRVEPKAPLDSMDRLYLELKSLTPKSLPEEMVASLLRGAAQGLEKQLAMSFPQNKLHFWPNNKRWVVEGFFNSEYPGTSTEAALEMGLLHKGNSDYVLAEHYLRNVLANRQYLPVKEREYEARYALAEIYLVQGKSYDYEQALLEIARRDVAYLSIEGAPARMRDQMRKVLLSDPLHLEKMFGLYRLEGDPILESQRLLGAMYLERRDYEKALMPLIFSVLKPFSMAYKQLAEVQYGYRFTTLQDFFVQAHEDNRIFEYLEKTGFWKSLFNLSRAIPGYAPNSFQASRQIWVFLSSIPEAGPYQSLAAEELRKLKF